jgi:hypothetical protein
MLGILFAQIWHWAEWTKKERPLIKVIVVSHRYLLKFMRMHWLISGVVGIVLFGRFELVRHGLVLQSVLY